jgi:type VI secretion system VasD/TssJ family lipoprotein
MVQGVAGGSGGRLAAAGHWPAWLTWPALLALALGGCASSKPKDPLADVSWSFANDAVMVEIVSDLGLNQYDGQSHTLLLGVYETADAQAFRNLAADPAALATSMATGKVPSTFLQISRYVVTPGQHSYLILDRAQNTHVVGIVAGYAQMSAATAVRQYDIPLVVTSKGFIFKTRTTAPGPLVVRMDFGAQGILNSQTLANGPSDADMKRAQQLEGGGKEIKLDAGCNCAASDACTCAGPSGTALRKLGN